MSLSQDLQTITTCDSKHAENHESWLSHVVREKLQVQKLIRRLSPGGYLGMSL